jgi:hypothetical protein
MSRWASLSALRGRGLGSRSDHVARRESPRHAGRCCASIISCVLAELLAAVGDKANGG